MGKNTQYPSLGIIGVGLPFTPPEAANVDTGDWPSVAVQEDDDPRSLVTYEVADYDFDQTVRRSRPDSAHRGE